MSHRAQRFCCLFTGLLWLVLAGCDDGEGSQKDVGNTDAVEEIADATVDATADATSPDTTPDTSNDVEADDGGTPATPGDTCETAVVLTGSQVLTNQTLAGYHEDLQFGYACGSVSGLSRVYSLTVAPGEQVEIQATPGTLLNLDLALIEGGAPALCAGPVACLRASDWVGFGEAEGFSYANYGSLHPQGALFGGDHERGERHL